MTQLVLTVGGSPAPLVTAIRTLQPDFVVFLCSEAADGTEGSYKEVPAIAAETGLKPTDYEIVRIANFDDLQACYLESRRALESLRGRTPHGRIVADYTGGTKSMSAGLAMAAVDVTRPENPPPGRRRPRSRVSGPRARVRCARASRRP